MKRILLVSLFAVMSLYISASTYNVTAITNNYGMNYSLSVRVEGDCFSNSCYVSQVYVYTESGVQTALWGPVIGSPGVYYVTYDYQTYYFRF